MTMICQQPQSVPKSTASTVDSRHMEDIITFEQPLNERVRTLLRLEHLFHQASYTLRGYSVWDSRATLTSLLNILEILSRTDFKTEVIKELERLHGTLSRLQHTPGVDTDQLNTILNQLQMTQNELHTINGQLGQTLREHELIASIKQRNSVAGGSCNFDLPAYHHWLQQPPEDRIEALEQWFDNLHVVQRPIMLILGVIRESIDPLEAIASKGFYQQNLDTDTPVQLIRVMLPNDVPYFAEISAGKHRLTIRFLQTNDSERATQTDNDVAFHLGCCAL